MYTKIVMNPLARAMVSRGWAVWNIEYRRVGPFGGGGWPGTLDDVKAAVDHVVRFPQIDLDRVVTCGHSAGGQLALWAAAQRPTTDDATGGAAVSPMAALALAGVVDLEAGYDLGLGEGAVERYMGGSPDQVPDRYAASSPAALLPIGVPHVLIHGLDDATVPPSMSAEYCKRAVAAGDDAMYVPLAGLTHRDLLSPNEAGWPAIATHLERLFAS
jgi:acetyl esterase/lipase